ncbi:MAG TPA: tryptophan 2,3-dioxygenase family protein [Planctomycetota bacterium]|nr:tryptophan 2,3-dioxygenase family protein [Planctomycetota bacterium]
MSFGRADDSIRYGSYLRVPELLDLQRPLTPEHDEVAFIVVHQVYELWFRLMRHELDAVVARLEPKRDDEAILEAARLLRRVGRIQDVLVDQLEVLETMRPADFLRFRDRLKPASGFQSAQFREIEVLAGLRDPALLARCDADEASMKRLQERMARPSLRDLLAGVARARGFDVVVAEPETPEFARSVSELCRLYVAPQKDAALYGLAEALVDFDQKLAVWRSRHVSMVERVIGGKIGTGASATGAGYEGVRYLQATLRKKAFPELWEVRTRLGETP